MNRLKRINAGKTKTLKGGRRLFACGIAVTDAVRRSAQKECRRKKIGVRELKGCGEVEVWNITD